MPLTEAQTAVLAAEAKQLGASVGHIEVPGVNGVTTGFRTSVDGPRIERGPEDQPQDHVLGREPRRGA